MIALSLVLALLAFAAVIGLVGGASHQAGLGNAIDPNAALIALILALGFIGVLLK